MAQRNAQHDERKSVRYSISAAGFFCCDVRGSEEQLSVSTSRTATPVTREELPEAANQSEGTDHEVVEEHSTPATAEQPSQSMQPGPSSGPDSSEQQGPSCLLSDKEGPPRNKRRKPNKQERAEKSMQKMLDILWPQRRIQEKNFWS